ncbi:MAG: hypothetical protein K0S23_2182 [Fluviicola sp.]|nr:hypothetical protein [Fluviicola sp.]
MRRIFVLLVANSRYREQPSVYEDFESFWIRSSNCFKGSEFR